MSPPTIVVKKDVIKLSGWPTDVVALDFDTFGRNENDAVSSLIHTYILFVPGNPGLVGWYVPALKSILQQVGPGYAVRGLSYAGHGVTKEVVDIETYEFAENDSATANVQIPWTVNGQVEHTIAWIDNILKRQSKQQKLMFISHSIGSHLVQRVLLLRPDLRCRTRLLMHWMPFIRMDAPTFIQRQLDFVASHPYAFIRLLKFILERMSKEQADAFLKKVVPDEEGRKLSVDLVQNPTFVRNFLELGTEEIRTLPQLIDVSFIGARITFCADLLPIYYYEGLTLLILTCHRVLSIALLDVCNVLFFVVSE